MACPLRVVYATIAALLVAAWLLWEQHRAAQDFGAKEEEPAEAEGPAPEVPAPNDQNQISLSNSFRQVAEGRIKFGRVLIWQN